MLIPCKEINTALKSALAAKVTTLVGRGVHPRLLAVIIGDSPAQESYIRIKRRIDGELGIDFVLWQDHEVSSLELFIERLHAKIEETMPHGVLIQQPLPAGFDPKVIFSHIDPSLDIEGVANDTYLFPLVQAALIGLSYAHDSTRGTFELPAKLAPESIRWLMQKRIAIAGRGATSGAPVARYFDNLHIPYAMTHSQTANTDEVYHTADIIISGVGKQVISRNNIKKGVVLLNFGLHQEKIGGQMMLKGDYEEDDVADIAHFYTGTPGGLGPIDVTCMFANVIKAAEKRE